MNCNELQTEIDRARTHIAHACDGPITSFVLISRALEAVSAGWPNEVVANALYEELVALEMMVGS